MPPAEPQPVQTPPAEESIAQPSEGKAEEVPQEEIFERGIQAEEVLEEGRTLFDAEEAEEILKLRKEAEKEVKPSRISLLPIILSLVSVLLFLAGFYYKEQLQHFFKVKFENLTSPKLEFSDIKGYSIENVKIGKLIVIKGTITNVSRKLRRSIKVKANLYDAQGKKIKEKFTYAGNVLPEQKLRFLSLHEIDAQLMKSSSSMKPGQSLQFMIVFPPMQEEVEEFNVEVISSR